MSKHHCELCQRGPRKRCTACGNLTHDWQRVNSGEVECWECIRRQYEGT